MRAVENKINEFQIEAEATGGASLDEAAAPNNQDHSTEVLRMVQTSITRFGTLIVISFMVSILVSIYRYDVRLSTFYRAYGDALTLVEGDLDPDLFDKLVTTLTPRLHFGRSPTTPPEQIVDAIKTAGELIRATRTSNIKATELD